MQHCSHPLLVSGADSPIPSSKCPTAEGACTDYGNTDVTQSVLALLSSTTGQYQQNICRHDNKSFEGNFRCRHAQEPLFRKRRLSYKKKNTKYFSNNYNNKEFRSAAFTAKLQLATPVYIAPGYPPLNVCVCDVYTINNVPNTKNQTKTKKKKKKRITFQRWEQCNYYQCVCTEGKLAQLLHTYYKMLLHRAEQIQPTARIICWY